MFRVAEKLLQRGPRDLPKSGHDFANSCRMTRSVEGPALAYVKEPCAIVPAMRECIRGFAKCPSCERGGWRAEKRKPMVSVILRDHGGRLSARQSRRLVGTGPRFSPVRHARTRRPILQPAPGRTSYWVREELRCRPGAGCASAGPQAPHLAPLHERLMIAPFKWTR